MHFFGGRVGAGPTEPICQCPPPAIHCDPSIIKIIPATYFSKYPYVDMEDVKSVNQGKLKGLVKSTRTPQGPRPPFYLAGIRCEM